MPCSHIGTCSVSEVSSEVFGDILLAIDVDECVSEVTLESDARPVDPHILSVDHIVIFVVGFFGVWV